MLSQFVLRRYKQLTKFLAEGKQIGLQEGAEQNKIETAKKLLQDNLPIEQIVKYTDLPLEKVQELANNINK